MMTPEKIAAAKRGHPDTITAHKVLVEAMSLLEDRIQTMSLCKTCADSVQMILGGDVVSCAFEDEEEKPPC